MLLYQLSNNACNNKKNITKLQWHNTVVFIAHISGVSRELVGGFVSSDWAHSLDCVPTGCPLVWTRLNRLPEQLESAPHVLRVPAGHLGHVLLEMIESQGKARLLESQIGGTTGAVFLHSIGQSQAGGQVQRQRQRMLQSEMVKGMQTG